MLHLSDVGTGCKKSAQPYLLDSLVASVEKNGLPTATIEPREVWKAKNMGLLLSRCPKFVDISSRYYRGHTVCIFNFMELILVPTRCRTSIEKLALFGF